MDDKGSFARNDFEPLLLFAAVDEKTARHEYHHLRRLTEDPKVVVAGLPEVIAILPDLHDCGPFSDQPFCGFRQAPGKKWSDIYHGSAAA